MHRIAERISSALRTSSGGMPLFDEGTYEPFQIRDKNFHEIPAPATTRETAYVDGGDAEIFRSPSLSIFFNRIRIDRFIGGKPARGKTYEFFTLITLQKRDDKLSYFAEPISMGEDLGLGTLIFDFHDSFIAARSRRVDISAIGPIFRRIAEIHAASELRGIDIVLDGTLESKHPEEKKVLQRLYDSPNHVCSLSKTCSDITDDAQSLPGMLLKMSPVKAAWYYHPVCKSLDENHLADVYYVKLHKDSKYVFRFEAHERQGSDPVDVISSLRENSRDPVFLGYPYGLVRADRLGRVSRDEAGRIRLELTAKLGKDFEALSLSLNAYNAHDILDRIG